MTSGVGSQGHLLHLRLNLAVYWQAALIPVLQPKLLKLIILRSSLEIISCAASGKVEKLAVEDYLTPEESAVVDHFNSHYTRLTDGRFLVQIAQATRKQAPW